MRLQKQLLRTATVLLLLIFCLSGCTKQRNMDIPEFCKRFNTAQSTEVLAPENFFCERADTVREYNCHLPIATDLTALLSLTTDESGTVTAVQLTCIPESETYPEEAFRALYETYTVLCAVLTVETADKAEESIRTAGILPETLAFTEYGFVGETEKHRYSVFSGEQYLALFCERI
ncbi:MAG: hypothetical protein ACI4K9_05950 [Candidatus Fimenecus sp.]